MLVKGMELDGAGARFEDALVQGREREIGGNGCLFVYNAISDSQVAELRIIHLNLLILVTGVKFVALLCVHLQI